MTGPVSDTYYRQLNAYLQWQTARIRAMETRMESMSREIAALRNQKGVTIEKIEYHFDQLKVDTLEGTLNVGLSPAGLGSGAIDDGSAGGEVIQTNTSRSESFARIQKRVLRYLQEYCPIELKAMEQQYQLSFGDDFHTFIIGDLQGQVNPRIDHYLQTMTNPGQLVLTEEQESRIAEQVIADIRMGMNQYFMRQQAQPSSEQEPPLQGGAEK